MKGVIKMRRPWLLSLVAFSVSPALQAADKSTRIAGFPCEAVRAEIVRRQAVLLARPTEEVSGILAKLVDAPTQYKRLVGQYLGTYKSAFEQVFVSNRLMNRLVQLKKDHAKLKEEAQQAGVLLPDLFSQCGQSCDPANALTGLGLERTQSAMRVVHMEDDKADRLRVGLRGDRPRGQGHKQGQPGEDRDEAGDASTRSVHRNTPSRGCDVSA